MKGPQMPIGFVARSNWGEGSDEAEYAVGSVVLLTEGCAAVQSGRAEPGLARIESCFSIGEGPEFYYRVCPSRIVDGRRLVTDWAECSDRLHIIPGTCDYTAGWVLLWSPSLVEEAVA